MTADVWANILSMWCTNSFLPEAFYFLEWILEDSTFQYNSGMVIDGSKSKWIVLDVALFLYDDFAGFEALG